MRCCAREFKQLHRSSAAARRHLSMSCTTQQMHGACAAALAFEVGDGCRQQALQDAELEGVADAIGAGCAAGTTAPRNVRPKRLRQFDRVCLPPA